MINEHLMRPGTGSLSLNSSVPISVTDDIFDMVNKAGPGGSVVVTKVRVDSGAYTDAQMLGAAIWSGPVTGRPSRISYEMMGNGAWLDAYYNGDKVLSSANISTVLSSLLFNGLTAGTVNTAGASNVTRTFPAYGATRGDSLDKAASLGGWEYRINPDFTVDAATAANLFQSPPSIIVTGRDEGSDSSLTGIKGSLINQNLSQLGPQILSRVFALTNGVGGAITVGSAIATPAMRAPDGSTANTWEVISAPAESAGNASTVALGYLNLRGGRRQLEVAVSDSDRLSTEVQCGDYVYAYDLAGGVVDTDNPVTFRGERIYPVLVRLLSRSWPIQNGRGVYFRENSATPDYIDVSDHVAWENGDAFWTVGDWSPPDTGRTNRRSPEIELQLSA